MSVTGELLANNARCAATFSGPLPPAGFTDLDEDVRQSADRIQASPFIPHEHAVHSFVFDVATGRRAEVK